MLKWVERKTLKKPLVSRWYSVSIRWRWWRSWVWHTRVSSPLCATTNLEQTSQVITTIRFFHVVEFRSEYWFWRLMEKHNSSYTYCPMPMAPLPWEFVAKNTCFRNLYVLWMNVCKKCHFPLSELSLPLRGCKRLAGVKKAWWNKFDICWIWTSLLPGCQGGRWHNQR